MQPQTTQVDEVWVSFNPARLEQLTKQLNYLKLEITPVTNGYKMTPSGEIGFFTHYQLSNLVRAFGDAGSYPWAVTFTCKNQTQSRMAYLSVVPLYALIKKSVREGTYHSRREQKSIYLRVDKETKRWRISYYRDHLGIPILELLKMIKEFAPETENQ